MSVVIAVIAGGYALFASIIWWSKASDYNYLEKLNSNLHEMLITQRDEMREYREKIRGLESTVSRIRKLCAKDGE